MLRRAFALVVCYFPPWGWSPGDSHWSCPARGVGLFFAYVGPDGRSILVSLTCVMVAVGIGMVESSDWVSVLRVF